MTDEAKQKPLKWLGTSRRDYASFPENVQHAAGQQLLLVQLGREPIDWKPMPTVGRGVAEIRITTKQAHRVFYVARFADAVYVLHVFEKRTQQTPQADIEKAQSRLAGLEKSKKEKEKK
jgi:phage-related protein